MDEAERQMHLRAGLFYGREATCGPAAKPKIKYHSEETALKSAVVMTEKLGREMEGYPCGFCGDWHIGRALSTEERVKFAEEVTQ